MRKLIQGFWVVMLLALASAGTQASTEQRVPDAFGMLAKMSHALRELDYRALFTYEFGGSLLTMRVTHQVADGLEYEYLERLNGPAIRIERDGASIDCLPPADQLLRGLVPDPGGNGQGLSQHYQFQIAGPERIADRDATLLHIAPRDVYRYGYSLSIDNETHLPLSAMTLGHNNRALERMQLSSLQLVPSDDWVEFVSTQTQIRRPRWPACNAAEPSHDFRWKVTWVPSGFLMAGKNRLQDIGEVNLFTDGLSTFSVFVKTGDQPLSAQGRAQRGATVAYMKQVEFNSVPYTITVVGEIPALTAQRVAGSVVMTVPEATDTLSGSGSASQTEG